MLTNYPLKQVLQKFDASGLLFKWAIKLNKFNAFKIMAAVKGQASAYFEAEFTPVPEMEPVDLLYGACLLMDLWETSDQEQKRF